MKAVLTISIIYDETDETLSDKKVRTALEYAVTHLVDNGLLSPEESTITQWNHSIRIVSDTPEGQLPLHLQFT